MEWSHRCKARLASDCAVRSRGEGGVFAFAGEFTEKRRQLAEAEKALAADVEDASVKAIAA